MATASIVVDEYKFVQFTISDGNFSGNNSIQQPGSTTWQDSYSKKPGTLTSDTGFIKYLSATSGVGAFQAGSGQGAGQATSGPYEYSYTDGIGSITDENGVITRADGQAIVTGFNAGDLRNKNTPFGFDSVGTINFTANGASAQTSWNSTQTESGVTTTSTGNWSGTLNFEGNSADLQLSNADWGLGDSAFVQFAVTGRVVPTASRTTPVSDVRVFWSSDPAGTVNPTLLGGSLINPSPIYWNHDSGLLQVNDLGLLNARANGAQSLVFVIDQQNALDEDTSNNLVSLPLPNFLVTSSTGTLTDGVFNFGVDSAGSADGQVTLHNLGTTNLGIQNITIDGHPLATPPSGVPGPLPAGQSLAIHFNVSELPAPINGRSSGDLLITTDLGQIRVPVELFANQAPIITPQNWVNVTTAVGTHSLPLAAEDFDLPKQTLLFTKESGPSEISVSSTGVVTWTSPGTPGSRSFTALVRVTDNGYPPKTDELTLTYYVNGPKAVDDPVSTPPDQAIAIDVLDNDSDPDGSIDATTVFVQELPSHGSVGLPDINGVLNYTPNAGFVGEDSFSYYVLDNDGMRSNLATVTINVSNNHPPTGLSLSANQVREYVAGATIGNVAATEPDGQTLSFTVSDSRFEIVAQKLKLKDNVSLLVAAGPISFEITATDTGSPAMSVSLSTTITVLANPTPWKNPVEQFDVDRDADVDVQDVVRVIRRLRSGGPQLPAVYQAGSDYVDVNGSRDVTILDAIDTIREIRRRRNLGQGGEGEGAHTHAPAFDAAVADYVASIDEQRKRTSA